MDHRYGPPPSERTVPPTTYPPPFAPATAQPPVQIPFSDPFHTSRDPFLPAGRERGDSFGLNGRAWHNSQATAQHQQLQHQQHHSHHPHHHQPPPAQSLPPPPPPPPDGAPAGMSLPYDFARRRSLGAPAATPNASHPPPNHAHSPFALRNMPPPSSPQLPTGISLPGPAPRGPPTTSPFAGARDLAHLSSSSSSSHRPTAGFSISSILGNDDKKPASSPHTVSLVHSPTNTKPMQPPSPGRARSSSMRDNFGRPQRETSPFRSSVFGEPRSASAALGQDRITSDPRREALFASPQLHRESAHSFRAFQPTQPLTRERPPVNGNGNIAMAARPNSQPLEAPIAARNRDDLARRDFPGDNRFGVFRHFGEPLPPSLREPGPSQEHTPFKNGAPPLSADRPLFHSPQLGREPDHQSPGGIRTGLFGHPLREEQGGPFRPTFVHQANSTPEGARESIESRAPHEVRRDFHRLSPRSADLALFDRARNGYPDRPLIDRPMTFEEHQRMEVVHRDPHRKESDGSMRHRLLSEVSPELSRKGRNSPLPQAVQGAQPRHVGPGGDNPGIKTEFGRMFSGLGSGVGGTPAPGTTTPRMSPARHLDDGNLVRTAVDHIDDSRKVSNASGRSGRKNRRRSRDDEDSVDGRQTPTARGNKRAKTNNSSEVQHALQEQEHQPSQFTMLRFPSNPIPKNVGPQQPTHPGYPQQIIQRIQPSARKPAVTVTSKKLIEHVASKERRHLGSQLYTTELALPADDKSHVDDKIRFNTCMKPIPLFEGRENCTYTVRVPRWYLTRSLRSKSGLGEPASELEMICRRRQLWGTDVYSDDSDVVAAAVHAGWIRGDFGELDEDLKNVDPSDGENETTDTSTTLLSKPRKPIDVPPEHDAQIRLLILPPLETYASTTQHHLRSRDWKKVKHDGMSFMIHRIDFTPEGLNSRYQERGMKARKERLVAEDAKRKEAAAGLLMFAAGSHGAKTRASDNGGAVRVGA